ncbi:MAG: DUF1287 domain-containing protein [Clostridiales bacterium]|nr:DUF1287 domain-containing protein [Clostridiales bacterium]
MRKRTKRRLRIAILLALLLTALLALYYFNVIPHISYSGEHFGLAPYVSGVDRDGDGVDDQTDILAGVRQYLATRPVYKSKYYSTGYPDDQYGVCTDVVAQGLLAAGYDLMTLVNEDIYNDPQAYQIDQPDINIDFRRVENLNVYFQNHAISLTTDIYAIDQWQGGDIVVFRHHIGVVSDRRNRKGVSFLIHHGSPWQPQYEQDVLENRNDIVAHYRIS